MDVFETRTNILAARLPAVVIAATAAVFFTGVPVAEARNIYLNGVDVSSSRSQELRNVQVRINEKGDIFISAPHYQVTEEDFFTPLARVGAPPTPPPGVSTGPSVAARDKPKEVQPEQREVVKAPVEPASDAPAGQSPGARSDGPGSFSPRNSGSSRQAPDSMPPVLDATPPASGTTPAPRSADANSK